MKNALQLSFVIAILLLTSTSILVQTGIYNVRDYGATGNGSTDDTGAIKAAISEAARRNGGTIFFSRC